MKTEPAPPDALSPPGGASRLRRRQDCRLCGGLALTPVLSLAPTPPANAFVPASEAALRQEAYPLELFLCGSCGHLQLRDVLDAAHLFENYVYVSGTSPVFVDHFRRYAAEMISLLGLKPGDLVVEIGSNDGTLLKFFKEAGLTVLGVDPARAIARQATESGINTWPTFFTKDTVKRITRELKPARLVCANNVFAHADDLRGMAEGVRDILAPDGAFVFEVSYLADVCEKALFDTIYHEHLAYHSAGPLKRFLGSAGLELIEAARVDSHGGSLRGIAQRKGGPRKTGSSVSERLAEEERLGLARPETFSALGRRIETLKQELKALLTGVKARGKRVAGFGAPAKATTFMHHFELGPDVLDFIVDDSPLKQGLFTPGLHVPVLPSAAIAQHNPDFLLILAWNFAGPIMAKHQAFARAGGKFIIPAPQVQILP